MVILSWFSLQEVLRMEQEDGNGSAEASCSLYPVKHGCEVTHVQDGD